MPDSMVINRGGVGTLAPVINLSVVSGASPPEAPAQNTLWVERPVSVGRWTVAHDAPPTPSVGDLWILSALNGSAALALGAVDAVAVRLALGGVLRWDGARWAPLSARLYTGEWVNVGRWLLKDGDRFTPLTGGYRLGYRDHGAGEGTHEANLSAMKITVNAGDIFASYWEEVSICTQSPVDVTHLRTLRGKFIFHKGLNSSSLSARFFVTTTPGERQFTLSKAFVPIALSSDTREELIMNVTGLSGGYYVGFAARSVGTGGTRGLLVATMTELWGE
ncbi:MAG: hypothetical protein LBU67_09545 [Oscillospiraceae bacterium]|jgi:hypothetical protein|nr:hypothetical protein [Oscillospiraceae bacterium]